MRVHEDLNGLGLDLVGTNKMRDTQHAKLYTVETVLEPNYIQNKTNIIEKS